MRFLVLFLLSISIFLFPASTISQEIKQEQRTNLLDFVSISKEKMEYRAAIDILKSAAQENSDNETKKFLAKLYYLSGNSKEALKIFKNLSEKDWQVFLYLGLVYEDLGNKNQAVFSYLNSITLKQNSIALYRLGKIYYYDKKYKKAAKFFSQTLSLDSSIRLANYYLGNCFLEMGDYRKAYVYSSKGINFYPENENIKKQLVEVKNKLGKDFFADLKKIIEETRSTIKLMFYKKEELSPLIRVGIATGLYEFTFRCGGDFYIKEGKKRFNGVKDKYYTIIPKGKKTFVIDKKTGTVCSKFKSHFEIKSSNYPFYLLDVTYGKGNFWHKKIDRIYRGDLKVILDKGITLINVISVEEYLYGVLPAEIIPTVGSDALKAQAVAARTLVFKNLNWRHKEDGFDVCADVHCQVYQGLSVENPRSNQAVNETKGEVLLYDNEPIEAIYHSNCGGCLRADAFGKQDYLVTQYDSNQKFYALSTYEEEGWFIKEPEVFCKSSKSNFRWQRVYDEEDFYLAFGFRLKDLKAILPREEGDSFHYKAVEVVTSDNKIAIKGDLKIREYFDKLRSSAFKAEIKFSENNKPVMLFFWGAGFGHGVGLCQEGAEKMAEEGYNYREILKHYYPNTQLKKIY